MIMQFGQQLAHSTNGTALDPSIQDAHSSILPRPGVFQSHSFQSHGLDHTSMPPEIAAHGLPSIPITQYTAIYESSIDPALPDRTLEDNENSETGARKKRGSSSTIANDNELRKLLRQYDGYTLKQMAAEVQKHDGAGGKSEKVKQVFAMIW
jgi:regulatory factor X, other